MRRWLFLFGLAALLLCYAYRARESRAQPTVYAVRKRSLAPEAAGSLKRLGLTKKDPVEIFNPVTGKMKTVHGRFLHVTDFHPDVYYKPGSDIDRMCHGGSGDAGKYGDAVLGCDSPMRLVKDTIDWIADNLGDKVDFIVWTGDNMRHDNDRQYPRMETDIFDMNEQISELMHDRFGDLPVPSLGNNDVYPHNLCAPGPTLQTREFFKIWKPFVPQLQLHLFARGVYFFQEVIPGKLAVLLINTLFLFQLNPLVDSCDRAKDPGYKLFLWLGYVLKEMRARNMKVWLTGHVPPTPKNYDVSCLRKYAAWSHEYRDVIIGGLYGHMNIDHFYPLDAKQAYDSLAAKYRVQALVFSSPDEWECDASDGPDDSSLPDLVTLPLEQLYMLHNATIAQDDLDGDFHVQMSRRFETQGGVPNRKVAYMESIRDTVYADVKRSRKSGHKGDRYSVVHITASVVPTFNPGLRVWEYNITELAGDDSATIQARPWDEFLADIAHVLDSEEDRANEDFALFRDQSPEAHAERASALKRDKTIPPKMPKDTPLGPAYVPQLFTPERYVQYYVDLKSVNKGTKDFGYEIEYVTDDKTYRMRDLTVKNWLKLARKLGESAKDSQKAAKVPKAKLWHKFLSHNFVSLDYENMGYG